MLIHILLRQHTAQYSSSLHFHCVTRGEVIIPGLGVKFTRTWVLTPVLHCYQHTLGGYMADLGDRLCFLLLTPELLPDFLSAPGTG